MSFECMKASVGSSRYPSATNNYGRAGNGFPRFEPVCLDVCMPNDAGSMRDEALFFVKQ
jgi:hypothetical protein